MLVDMDIKVEAARNLLWKAAASATESGFPNATMAARAKIFASESAIEVTNDALQLYGAAGYSRNQPMERAVRDARMFAIAGGTAQILRTVVASRLLDRKPCGQGWVRQIQACPGNADRSRIIGSWVHRFCYDLSGPSSQMAARADSLNSWVSNT